MKKSKKIESREPPWVCDRTSGPRSGPEELRAVWGLRSVPGCDQRIEGQKDGRARNPKNGRIEGPI